MQQLNKVLCHHATIPLTDLADVIRDSVLFGLQNASKVVAVDAIKTVRQAL